MKFIHWIGKRDRRFQKCGFWPPAIIILSYGAYAMPILPFKRPIAIYQPQFIWFRRNFVCWCEFWFRGWSRDQKLKFYKSKMADARHLENRLSAVATPYCPRNAKFRGMKQTRTQVQVTDQIANYENSRWRMFAILKMVYCYISTAFNRVHLILMKFGLLMRILIPRMVAWQKSKIFRIHGGRRR